MFKYRSTFKNIILGEKHGYRRYTNYIQTDKILLVSKLSRYECERMRHRDLNEYELKTELKNRGIDVDQMLHHHDLHKRFEDKVVKTLREMGINVEVVNRFQYNEEKVRWADVVMPVGGDGTFLLASSRVRDLFKPVVGFNSDPNRSEGHLCLPKQYSSNVRGAVERLQTGNFEWLLRSRIRIQILCKNIESIPKYLHEIDVISEKANPIEPLDSSGRVLPYLALNEVFIGETLSARVSSLQMRLNGSSEQIHMKCSGVCLCTGTGSTSWHLSINRLPVQSVKEILSLVKLEPGTDLDKLATEVTNKFNENLIFKADDKRIGYTIRDLIQVGVWPKPQGIKHRDFARKVEMKSNCYDAILVVDGGVSFPFNDGTVVTLQIKDEDALRTVIMN